MKHALIAGGTGGIGEGGSRALAAKGWRVTATGVTEAEVRAYDAPDGVKTRPLDATDDGQVAAFLSELNRLDGLVNCTGNLRKP